MPKDFCRITIGTER